MRVAVESGPHATPDATTAAAPNNRAIDLHDVLICDSPGESGAPPSGEANCRTLEIDRKRTVRRP
jgi:hypothetical protein